MQYDNALPLRLALPLLIACAAIVGAVTPLAATQKAVGQAVPDPDFAPDRPLAERAATALRIGVDRDASRVPALLTAIRALPMKTDAERAFVHLALDAIIETGAKLTPKQSFQLAHLTEPYYPAIFCLLRHAPKPHTRTLALMLDRPRLGRQAMLAISALLGDESAPGMAAALLRHFPPDLPVFVFAEDPGAIGLGGGIVRDISEGSVAVPRDFPSFHYRRRGGRGIRICGRGRNSVVVRRTAVDPGGKIEFGSCFAWSTDLTLRFGLLSRIAGIPTRELSEQFAPRSGTIIYEDAEQYRTEMRQIRDKAVAAFEAVKRRFVAQKLITAAEARGIKATTTFRILDERRKKAKGKLPPLNLPSPDAGTSDATPPTKKTAAAPQGAVKIGRIHWFSDYDRAKAVAKRVGKPLYLHFGENPG